MTLVELKLDVVILACAVSAGVHVALAGGLAVSVVLLALAGVLTRHPTQRTLRLAMALLTALLVAHAVDPVYGLATVTAAIEATALAVAATLAHPNPRGALA